MKSSAGASFVVPVLLGALLGLAAASPGRAQYSASVFGGNAGLGGVLRSSAWGGVNRSDAVGGVLRSANVGGVNRCDAVGGVLRSANVGGVLPFLGGGTPRSAGQTLSRPSPARPSASRPTASRPSANRAQATRPTGARQGTSAGSSWGTSARYQSSSRR